uniref:Condensation domain-containing protein n=1 Tax=Chromera velia CCMP2878 TaxID=1169474 RepID=A0A0G4FVP6_9ALVE|eukprot:Cvel_19000.t1-p1 / transcript=Cvel_19000.t1 / gene=Cvel_19000 / organism=Chromera_velia_CCMP2878 / gene_product=hypothetical protein / transcript_product=hypothetical protein / location=Cvel_scaffold1608:10530-13282(+) / protein_length=757 / sequence_SO=supercontig / SO=protein_coding / is_pseudo=false
MFQACCQPRPDEFELNVTDLMKQSEGTKQMKIRKLDRVDRKWDLLHDFGNLMIMNSVTMRSTKEPQLEDVRVAATALMKRHQTLRTRIVPISNLKGTHIEKYYFEMTGRLVPDVKQSSFTEYASVMDQEQMQKFDSENGPLWRIILCRSQKVEGEADGKPWRTNVVALFHHSIMDGMARQEFWTELFGNIEKASNLRESLAKAQPQIVQTVPPLQPQVFELPAGVDEVEEEEEFLSGGSGVLTVAETADEEASTAPSLASRTDAIISRVLEGRDALGTRLPKAVSSFLPEDVPSLQAMEYLYFLKNTGHALTEMFRTVKIPLQNPFSTAFPAEKWAQQVEREDQHRTRIMPMWIDKGVTRKLLDRCKAEGVSMNSILTAIAAAAMSELIKKKKDAGEVNLGFHQAALGLPMSFYSFQAISTRRWAPEVKEAAKKKADGANKQKIVRRDSMASVFSCDSIDAGPNGKAPHRFTSIGSRQDSSIGLHEVPVDTRAEIQSQSEGILSPPLSSRVFSPSLTSSASEVDLESAAVVRRNVPSGYGYKGLRRVSAPAVPSYDFSRDSRDPGLGSYAVLTPCAIDVPSGNLDMKTLWKSAMRVKNDLRKKVDDSDPTAATWNWQVITAFVCEHGSAVGNEKLLKQIAAPKIRPSCFLVSNTGNWNLKEKSDEDICASDLETPMKVSIESSWSCVKQDITGNSVFAHNLVTINGRLCWSLQYHTNLTGKALVEEYAAEIQRLIKEAGEAGSVEGAALPPRPPTSK